MAKPRESILNPDLSGPTITIDAGFEEFTREIYAAPPDDLGLVRCFDCTNLGWLRDSNAPDGFAAYCRLASEVPDPIRRNQDLSAWRRCPKWEQSLTPRRRPVERRR